LFSLPQEVEAERNRIEEERADLEDKVSKMIEQQHSDITTLLNDISELKKFTLAFEMEEANAKVDELLARISNFKETKEIINHDIVTLELGD
jgi:predicted TIM-barrel fold metal-dependent hydrolase